MHCRKAHFHRLLSFGVLQWSLHSNNFSHQMHCREAHFHRLLSFGVLQWSLHSGIVSLQMHCSEADFHRLPSLFELTLSNTWLSLFAHYINDFVKVFLNFYTNWLLKNMKVPETLKIEYVLSTTNCLSNFFPGSQLIIF